MKAHEISLAEFESLVIDDHDSLMEPIRRFEAVVVKGFMTRDEITWFRDICTGWAAAEPPSWHPCLDEVPDYHRINDEYPGSWVKARAHMFFLHRWNSRRNLFDRFKTVFTLKNRLAGEADDAFCDTTPSDGVISRIVIHQYPCGGGYLEDHVDPTTPFARVQTIIQAAEFGADFTTGGLYARGDDGTATFFDPLTEVGDLLLLAPDIVHGVGAIDPDIELDWARGDGRWMILPVIVRSDVDMDPSTKPRGLGTRT